MDDNGDTVVGDHGLYQTGGLFFVLQCAAGQADVAAAFLNGSDAGAGAGGIIGEGNAGILFHKILAQRADHLFHRGGAVGGDSAFRRSERAGRQGHHQSQNQSENLLHTHIPLSLQTLGFRFLHSVEALCSLQRLQ